MNPFERTERLW